MGNVFLRMLALCATLLAFSLPVHGQAVSTIGDPNNARVIVKYKADSSLLRTQALSATAQRSSRAQALSQRLGLSMTAGAAIAERVEVMHASGISSAELAQRLANQSDIEYAVPEGRKHIVTAPNDPLYAAGVPGNGPAVGQWYLRAPSGAVRSSIDIETAWNVTKGNPAVVVADVDTGVRFEHPDLLAVVAGGKLLPGYDMISDVPTGNTGLGRNPDASDPGDWVTTAESNNPNSEFYGCGQSDSSWHGTQVAGLVVAITNNGIGMASVGPNLRLLPVRALGKCGGDDSDILAGMLWAAGISVPGVPANPTPARVINLSLGGAGPCDAAYQDAVNQILAAGVVIVVAAGNEEGGAVDSPGNCVGVIAVGGLRHAGTKVGYSNLGPEVAISSPAGNCPDTAPNAPCTYPILTTSNSGTTTPVASIYTDSYNTSLGTSFSTPLVAGTAALMLSVQAALTPQQVRVMLESTARQFPTTSDSAGVPQCTEPQTDIYGNPIPQDECICTIDTCGAGMLNAGAAVTAAVNGAAAAVVQSQGLWWNAPAGSESGWGINFAQQGSSIFATWFTYDTTGKQWWLSVTANKTAASPDTYTGQLIASSGPPFSAVPFNPALVNRPVVGSATLVFNDVNRGSFSYTVNGIQQTKSITRQAFGPVPTCTYGPQPDFFDATNYQDLWWVAGGAEAGWGINLTHQGANIFATWFTYDTDGTPLWLSVTLANTVPGVYTGQLIQTSGPPFAAVPFNPALVTRSVVGTATLTFANGNAATFAYTAKGVTQAKQITRELFAPPAGTLCQ